MSSNSALMPDRDRFERFVKGDSPLGTGTFWMVNMLKFKEGGAAEFHKYVEAVKPLMEQAGGKCIFRLYENVATVIDGGGLIPDWDGIFIGEYPSPAAFGAFSTSEAYRKAHKHRAAALEKTEMYACHASWVVDAPTGGKSVQTAADLNMDMSIPKRLADEKAKDKAAMKAIKGNPAKFMQYIQDDRFMSGRVWQLNFLKYEGDGRAKYYHQYGARAQAHISGTMKKGSGGGMQLMSRQVWALKGTEFDSIAIMQYPSREAFVNYAAGSEGGTGMSDGFILRTAGLAVQGLVSLGPEVDAEAVQDPNGPTLQPTSKL